MTFELLSRDRWQQLAPAFADYSYRQVWDFGVACAQRLGAASEHVAVLDGGELLGLADVRVKRLPLLPGGIAYITGGPMVRPQGRCDPRRLRLCLQALLAEYVDRRGLCLRIVAPLGEPAWNDAQNTVFADLGFEQASHWPGYRTLLLDIDRPLEAIRKTFEQKWRNGLNRAERNNLVVRDGTGADLFEPFLALYRQLLDRKGFEVDLHADFYAAVQHDLPENERFHVSLAEEAGRPVAGHVAGVLGDTCVYLLGATSQQGIGNKSSYLLQWHTIQQAKQRGCRWYDLGGIDPEGNPGVYHFKQGLGGIDVSAPGPFEKSPRGLRRHIVRGCERVYRSARRLRQVGR